MKLNHLPQPAIALFAAGFTLLISSCSKEDRVEAKAAAKEAYTDSKAALSDAWQKVKSYSFEKRAEFKESGKALASRMETKLGELRANYSEAKASLKKKAAMAELKLAETDYKQKLEALGDATAATWESAKQKTVAAWEKLEAAYQKARED